MVGPNGLEPSTSSVSRKRSNQTELRAYIFSRQWQQSTLPAWLAFRASQDFITLTRLCRKAPLLVPHADYGFGSSDCGAERSCSRYFSTTHPLWCFTNTPKPTSNRATAVKMRRSSGAAWFGGLRQLRCQQRPMASPVIKPPMCAELSMPGTTAPKKRLYPANESRLFIRPRNICPGYGNFPR